MAVNYFVGKTQAWLEAELAKVQADIAAGKTITTASSGDVASGKMVETNAKARFDQLYYALYLLAPTTYPQTGMRVSRTRFKMYQS